MTAPSPPSWPPPNGLTSIHVPRLSALQTFSTQITISAPAPLVFDVIRNVSAYRSWSTLIASGSIISQPPHLSDNDTDPTLLHNGTHFNLTVTADPTHPVTVPQIVSDISTPNRPSNYVSKELLESDGSFYPDVGKVWRVAWITVSTFPPYNHKFWIIFRHVTSPKMEIFRSLCSF